MSFRILGLDPAPFRPLVGLSDAALAARGARRYVVDADPGFPDRIEVRDLAIGETAILLNYEHQPADTPYRARHAIFIGERATQALDQVDVVPEALRTGIWNCVSSVSGTTCAALSAKVMTDR